MNLIAITNPNDESAEAGFVHSQVGHITVESIIPEYGDKIEDGAQIVIVDDGPDPRVWQYIAERHADKMCIRVNNTMMPYTCDVGPYVTYGTVDELETFTVFGINAEDEHFVAVVAATEDTVYRVGREAGCMNEGHEIHDVYIDIILKGDQARLERVTV